MAVRGSAGEAKGSTLRAEVWCPPSGRRGQGTGDVGGGVGDVGRLEGPGAPRKGCAVRGRLAPECKAHRL